MGSRLEVIFRKKSCLYLVISLTSKNFSIAMPHECPGEADLSYQSPTRAAAYTVSFTGCTAIADAGAATLYASQGPPATPLPGVCVTVVSKSVVPDVFTTRMGPSMLETYAMSRPSSTATSRTTYLSVRCRIFPGSASSCVSSIDLSTEYDSIEMVVRLALPSLLDDTSSHFSSASPMPHRWATCISRVMLLTSKSAMRELVPSKRMSLIRA